MDISTQLHKIIETVPGWCNLSKAQMLATLTSQRKPALYVEIGVFGGRSLFPVALAMKSIGNGKAIGIDPWAKWECLEDMREPANLEWWGNLDLEDIYEGCKKHLAEFELADHCELMRGRADEVVYAFADESIGMLHIDGNHSSAPAMRDVTAWLPKVTPGGVIIVDDTGWTECGNKTVVPAVNYLLANGCLAEHIFDNYEVLRKSLLPK